VGGRPSPQRADDRALLVHEFGRTACHQSVPQTPSAPKAAPTTSLSCHSASRRRRSLGKSLNDEVGDPDDTQHRPSHDVQQGQRNDHDFCHFFLFGMVAGEELATRSPQRPDEGSGHRFSEITIPAALPGSTMAAACRRRHRAEPRSRDDRPPVKVSDLHRDDGAVRVLPDEGTRSRIRTMPRSTRSTRRGSAPGQTCTGELDHQIVDRPHVIEILVHDDASVRSVVAPASSRAPGSSTSSRTDEHERAARPTFRRRRTRPRARPRRARLDGANRSTFDGMTTRGVLPEGPPRLQAPRPTARMSPRHSAAAGSSVTVRRPS
jgi:hypothetical protein